MSSNDDLSPEPWPFVQEPPALQVTRRGQPSTVPVSPPPLEIRQRGQESNTASQTAPSKPSVTQIPKQITNASEVPQQPSKSILLPPPLTITQRSSQKSQKTSPFSTPVASSPPPPPPRVVKEVYVLVGYNQEEGSVHLGRIMTDLEVGSRMASSFIGMVEKENSALIKKFKAEDLYPEEDDLRLTTIPLTPLDKAKGVVFRAEIDYQGEPVYIPIDEDDEDRDPDDEREIDHYEGAHVVYSWAILKRSLTDVVSLDLNSILEQ